MCLFLIVFSGYAPSSMGNQMPTLGSGPHHNEFQPPPAALSAAALVAAAATATATATASVVALQERQQQEVTMNSTYNQVTTY